MCVLVEPALTRLAIEAFRSFISAYSKHEHSTRNVFDLHTLHLGHVARHFALKDPPSKMVANYYYYFF